ncbi:hypothetical protein IW261DRAFT_1572577 [Armillaria novae-zelandiae]|uniref:Uncharacterized protein n=1 Tax=Armillaria novae-zelandiae TaxID=153914 RepID=A0AA39TV01_9AGAR|nr:hypothetical protein IW261DRAFT_1572577 [Armillaria novae-zelandiae]
MRCELEDYRRPRSEPSATFIPPTVSQPGKLGDTSSQYLDAFTGGELRDVYQVQRWSNIKLDEDDSFLPSRSATVDTYSSPQGLSRWIHLRGVCMDTLMNPATACPCERSDVAMADDKATFPALGRRFLKHRFVELRSLPADVCSVYRPLLFPVHGEGGDAHVDFVQTGAVYRFPPPSVDLSNVLCISLQANELGRAGVGTRKMYGERWTRVNASACWLGTTSAGCAAFIRHPGLASSAESRRMRGEEDGVR